MSRFIQHFSDPKDADSNFEHTYGQEQHLRKWTKCSNVIEILIKTHIIIMCISKVHPTA